MDKLKPIILIASFREPSAHGGDLERDAVETTYVKAVLIAGGDPLIVPYGESDEDIMEFAEVADGLLIPGGGDIEPTHYGEEMHEKMENVSRERDELELALVKSFLLKKKPIFGICRGAQIMNVAMGGTLYRDLETEVPTSRIQHWKNDEIDVAYQFGEDKHVIKIEEGTFLAKTFVMIETTVNSLHHQAIKDVASGLRVGAKSEDGVIEEVESLSMDEYWLLGVQWHPEALIERHPENKILFERFIQASHKI